MDRRLPATNRFITSVMDFDRLSEPSRADLTTFVTSYFAKLEKADPAAAAEVKEFVADHDFITGDSAWTIAIDDIEDEPDFIRFSL